MFSLQDAFYRPLWIRVVIVAICAAWAGFEFVNGAPGWAMLFGAVGAWAFWQFFVVWTDPPPKQDAEKTTASKDDAGSGGQ